MTHQELAKTLTIEGANLIDRLSKSRQLLAQAWIYLPREGALSIKIAAFLDEGFFGEHNVHSN